MNNLKNLYKLGLNTELENEFKNNYDGYSLARVTVQYRNIYKIETNTGEMLASVCGKLKYELESKEDYPAVGDWVVYKSEDNTNGIIYKILKRKTTICRKVAGPKSDEQILATNVDKIFITMSLNNDFNLRRLERYINIAWDSGAKPIIVLTKADLCYDLNDKLNDIESVCIGIDVIVVSALSGEGIDNIKHSIKDNDTVVFIGSSGVGKSTLINKLLNKNVQITKETGEYDKGRHTTTHRELFLLESGGVVIDTPGMRELQLSKGDLESTFKDIEEISTECRFKDCKHKSEPGCAVKKAIEEGIITKERFKSYEKIQRELIYAQKRRKSKERRNSKNSI